MAGGRIDSLQRMVKVWNEGDIDRLLEELGPEFEFTPDPSFPDAGTYRRDEVGPWMREWARTWQDNALEFLGFTEYEGTVVAESRWHLAAPESGEKIPVGDFCLVFWFRGEKSDRPAKMAAFFDRERAHQVAQEPTG